jgi:hypothetical protein
MISIYQGISLTRNAHFIFLMKLSQTAKSSPGNRAILGQVGGEQGQALMGDDGPNMQYT